MITKLMLKALKNTVDENKKIIEKLEKEIEIKPKEKKGLFKTMRYHFRIGKITGSQYSFVNQALSAIYLWAMIKYVLFGTLIVLLFSINFAYKSYKKALESAKLILKEKEQELENMKKMHPQIFEEIENNQKEKQRLKEQKANFKEKEFSDWSKYDGSNTKYDQNDAQ